MRVLGCSATFRGVLAVKKSYVVFCCVEDLLWFSFDPENVNQHAELHGNVLKEAAQVNPEYKFVWYDTAALEDHAIEVRPFFFFSNAGLYI